ncbi:MAG: rhodanese-like domain-containing protein [Gammaproteobacteria bacterium]|nr:MAG: rhodanese-like domain-containing protein [Gammaproteobacteria bacterium]
MKTFSDLVAARLGDVEEEFPWDIEERSSEGQSPLIVDVREHSEFSAMHIEGSLHVPRGILESACDYNYEETIPELVEARDSDIVVVCRSGNRSVLAAYTMRLMGYTRICSMKTGLRGWNDYELPLVNIDSHPVTVEEADEFFTTRLRPEQESPKN